MALMKSHPQGISLRGTPHVLQVPAGLGGASTMISEVSCMPQKAKAFIRIYSLRLISLAKFTESITESAGDAVPELLLQLFFVI